MSRYWLFEMDIFAEGESEGVGVRQVFEYESKLPPFHKVYDSIIGDCPVQIDISFKLAKEIDKDCFDYFESLTQKKESGFVE